MYINMSKTPKLKFLSGADLVPYIQQRQAKKVRHLRQTCGIQPKLVIVKTISSKPIETYIRLKSRYGAEIGIETEVLSLKQAELATKIPELAQDQSVHGIIVQLPLEDPAQTTELLNLIPAEKDVDGLSLDALVEPATAKAILWLLLAYGVDVDQHKILIVGLGRLVGSPLFKILSNQTEPQNLRSIDDSNSAEELQESLDWADVVITATGKPNLIKFKDLHFGQALIDAGASEQNGKLTGDLSSKIYSHGAELKLKVTPKIGGVGPLTIACLFENLLDLIDLNR